MEQAEYIVFNMLTKSASVGGYRSRRTRVDPRSPDAFNLPVPRCQRSGAVIHVLALYHRFAIIADFSRADEAELFLIGADEEIPSLSPRAWRRDTW